MKAEYAVIMGGNCFAIVIVISLALMVWQLANSI